MGIFSALIILAIAYLDFTATSSWNISTSPFSFFPVIFRTHYSTIAFSQDCSKDFWKIFYKK